jgi:hypothetical protein
MQKSNLILGAAVAAAMSGVRARTYDNQFGMMTFDRATIDSAGAFLIGELERLDQTLNLPLVEYTWSRDITLREDVSIGDEQSSFTNSSFAAAGGPSPNGKSWVGKDANAIAGLALDIGKTANPLTLWAMELGWTLPELASAQQIGRPIDTQKFEGMNLKYNMDIDEQVYIGDSVIGVTGLVNNAAVPVMNALTGNWSNPATTADQILADINKLLSTAWQNTSFAICPRKLLVDPISFGALVTKKVSDAGNISVLEYVKVNCISMAKNGAPLDVQPVKWLTGRGAGATNRAVAYTNDKSRVRFPLVPLQRTPLEYRNLHQLTTYYGRLGTVEVVYEETLHYMDGV